jgi:hypothetical protein
MSGTVTRFAFALNLDLLNLHQRRNVIDAFSVRRGASDASAEVGRGAGV